MSSLKNVTKITKRDGNEEIEYGNLDSVEISRGAKGQVTFSVKCYGNTIGEAEQKAVETFKSLENQFVMEG